jgi:hypothetical protein
MAQPKLDPTKPLTELAAIVGQVEAAKDVDREARSEAKMWAAVAVRFDEAMTGTSADEGRRTKAALYQKASEGLGGLSDAAALARKIADKLNPVAEVNWTQETVDDLLVSVRFYSINGFYDPEQLTTAQSLIEKAGNLSKRATGTGTRGEGVTVMGRPEWVQVVSLAGDEPEQITLQRGNKESSAGNIYKSVRGWLEARKITVTDDMATAIKAAVGKCVRDDEKEVAIGDFAVIRHSEAPAA